MADKYKNSSSNKLIISGPTGTMMEITPGQIVELSYGIARRGFPYLVKVDENRQLLVEAPLPVEAFVEESPKASDESEPTSSVTTEVSASSDTTTEASSESPVEVVKVKKTKKSKKVTGED